MELPSSNEHYGTQEYWDDRYNIDLGLYDWFGNSPDLHVLIASFLEKEATLLHLGCGNSELPISLYKNGFKQITNIDYSSVVIETMKEKTSDLKQMSWIIGDIFNLDACLEEKLFQAALDKGTLDAILTEKHDPWDPKPEILLKVNCYINQVLKHLKDGGMFLHITFAQPHFRKLFLTGFSRIITHKLEGDIGGFEYFCYQCFK